MYFAASMVLGVYAVGQNSFAEPLPLPYRSQPPFIPVFDLNGPPRKGLILSAEEVLGGRPAPITVGNATFIPAVRRAGQRYGGYTSIRGDLEILGGDVYLNGQPVGADLEQMSSELSAQQNQLSFQADLLGEQAGQLDGLSMDLGQAVLDLGRQDQRILQNSSQISALESTAQQHQKSIGFLNQSVQSLGQTTLQHAAILREHDQAIDALAVDLISTKQSLRQMGEKLADLGSGMAGATALASALSSVPNTSDETRVTCGVGSGTYSNRYALAIGCALRLSNALSLNGAGSYLFNGGVDYGAGSLSDIAGRFGFVYRFGGSSESSSSRRQIESLQSQLDEAKDVNRQIVERLEAVAQRLRWLESLAQAN
jgi:chromosome segregation ATPase